MYSFLFKPKWIGFHLLCLAAIVAMVNLGLWQLGRLDEKQTFNDRVTAHDAAEPVPLTAELLTGEPNDLIFRRVEAIGSYLPSPQFEMVNVTQDSTTGRNVVNAFQLSDGSLVLVNRGFVPTGSAVPAPPTGEVAVLARLKAGQTARTGQPRDDGSAELTEIRRVDLAALAQQFDQPIAPMFLDLLQSTPAEPSAVSPVAFPNLSEGPHLSYTIQWFIFTICVAVGWVFAVRKSVRERSGGPPKGPSKFKAVERYDPSAS